MLVKGFNESFIEGEGISEGPANDDNHVMLIALFVWFISRTFSANEQYFSLTTNQPTVFSAITYQPSKQGIC